MESKRKFYKTVFQIEVLSEEPYSAESLTGIEYDITEGHCSGHWEVKQTQTLGGEAMAKELREQGSEPDFFNLTEKGEDTEE